MATYNGGRYIRQQICSIQQQEHADWILLVRDDGSSDDTVAIVADISARDARIKLIHDTSSRQGAIGNFSILMQVALESGADYLLFADQDDVWAPEKILTMLGAMHTLEQTQSQEVPLLIHCDLAVVGEELRPIADSFVRFSRLSPEEAGLGLLLCQNQVTGCACLINRALLALACPVPSQILMHDWWVALIASAAGKIGFIPTPMVLYRQHGGNVLGAVPFRVRLMRLVFSPKQWSRHVAVIKQSFNQAAMLERRLRERAIALSSAVHDQIHTYANVLHTAAFKRVWYLRAARIGKAATGSGLVYLLLVTAMSKKLEDNSDA